VPLGVTGTQVFAVKESYSHVFKTGNFGDLSLIIVSSTLTSSLSVASSNSRGQDTSATNNSTTSTILLQQVPLIDMGSLTYKGFFGGLYPNMSNTVPSAHDTAGLAAAAQIQPLNTSGVADSVNGKIVLLSIGMSNATQDFCTAAGNDGVTYDS
jgi:hypothetical protein